MGFFQNVWDSIKRTINDLIHAKTWVQQNAGEVLGVGERIRNVLNSTPLDNLVDALAPEVAEEALDYIQDASTRIVKYLRRADDYNDCLLDNEDTITKLACVLKKAYANSESEKAIAELEVDMLRQVIHQKSGEWMDKEKIASILAQNERKNPDLEEVAKTLIGK